jgi:hypothetical protein
MSTSVVYNGTTYLIPTAGETGWAANLSAFLVDVGNSNVSLTGSQLLSNKQIRFAAGSAGTPSISFALDTDTGAYMPTAGTMALVANGATKLMIDGNNNNIRLQAPIDTTNSGSFIQSIQPTSGFRNFLLNGTFQVKQRNPGTVTSAGFAIDRWQVDVGGVTGARSVSITQTDDAGRVALQDELATDVLQYAVTNAGGTTDYEMLKQNVENIRLFSKKAVTVSFWARATSGTPQIGIRLASEYGTGGSTHVFMPAQSVTLSNTFNRYSVTFDPVTSAGSKVIGPDSFLSVQILLSAGSSFGFVNTGTVSQTTTVQFWGFQLEVGTGVSALEKRLYQQELVLCQRYIQSGSDLLWGYAPTGIIVAHAINLRATMRGTPQIVTSSFSASSGIGTPAFSAVDGQTLQLVATTNATGQYSITGQYVCSAEVSGAYTI